MPVGLLKDGDARFVRGMDSLSNPTTLPPEAYSFAVNMLNRGGVVQTRPGYDWRFTLPAGQLQGLKVFTPRLGLPVLLALVSGVPYVSAYPFRTFSEVGGARMSATAKRVYGCQATKSVERNADLSLRLITPQSLLMLQDGLSPATYFDGRVLTTRTGRYATPQGTHMAWSGSRLWVARGEILFACDIADPLNAVEQQLNTLGGIRYYVLSGKCTGLAETPGTQRPNLLAFTADTTTMFRTSVLDRDAWASLEDFQRTIFPTLGCAAPRSIVARGGMLWWYSSHGQVRLDTAMLSQESSRVDYLDNEMETSKSELSRDLSGVASTVFENFLLTSVPHASNLNRHTWVLDESPFDRMNEDFPPAWASVWTGINPVEWARVNIHGTTRLFVASTDDDGQNRVYEAFTDSRRDNGVDIPWVLETRAYTAGAIVPKHLRFAEYSLSELAGQLCLKVSWASPSRGRWKTCATRKYLAKEGNVDASTVYDYDSPLYGLKAQTRVDRTEDVREDVEDALSSAGVEGGVFKVEPEKEAVDTGFQLRFEGSGPCAFQSIRVFMDPAPEPDSGAVGSEEVDDHFVRFDGAAARAEEDLQAAPATFTSTKTGRAQYRQWVAEAEATVTSKVSQCDADKRASQVAREKAERQLRVDVPPYEGAAQS
jgi:hypothetical protein